MKVTQWFPRYETPTREGVYQVRIDDECVWFSRWRNGTWCLTSRYAESAGKHIEKSSDCYQCNMEWRGLAEKPRKP